MWDSSVYGGNATGGFFNDTNQVEDTPGKDQKVRRLQSVVPIVVRQIRDCEEDEFSLFGMPAQILSLVGIVTDYEVQSTKAIYTIQDHSGSIKAIWWLESDDENTPKLPLVKENAYVQLFGSIRVQDNEKMLMVLKMFPVDDANIITSHLLQVVHARLEAEAMLSNPGGPNPIIKKNNPGAELANSMTYFDDGRNQDSGLTPIQQKVFEILKSAPLVSGVHKPDLLRQFPAHQSFEIGQALEFLINEGHAYSTIDTEHYKATDTY